MYCYENNSIEKLTFSLHPKKSGVSSQNWIFSRKKPFAYANLCKIRSIVAMRAFSVDPCSMVMEFMPSGNLYSYLHSKHLEL